MTVQVSSVLCGGTGPKLAFNFHGLADDFSVDTQTERTCFIDPSIGDGIGNIHCRWFDNRANLVTPCQAYQSLLDETQADVICYSHDDLTVFDPDWLTRVMELFENNDKCVAVGLGGALGLGTHDLYRKRYHISQLQRIQYGSNAVDAETHGERVTGSRRVAVIEQFFMAVRVEWLRSRGGWSVENLSHHGLDMWLACQAVRDEKEIWQYAAKLLHSGGSSSVSDLYKNAAWLQGGSMEEDHRRPHKFLYEEFRDCLPIQI